MIHQACLSPLRNHSLAYNPKSIPSAELCLTPCDITDCSLPGSSIHGISQARILEWVAISFSRGSPQSRNRTFLFCIGRQILYYWATREAHTCIYTLHRPWVSESSMSPSPPPVHIQIHIPRTYTNTHDHATMGKAVANITTFMLVTWDITQI